MKTEEKVSMEWGGDINVRASVLSLKKVVRSFIEKEELNEMDRNYLIFLLSFSYTFTSPSLSLVIPSINRYVYGDVCPCILSHNYISKIVST